MLRSRNGAEGGRAKTRDRGRKSVSARRARSGERIGRTPRARVARVVPFLGGECPGTTARDASPSGCAGARTRATRSIACLYAVALDAPRDVIQKQRSEQRHHPRALHGLDVLRTRRELRDRLHEGYPSFCTSRTPGARRAWTPSCSTGENARVYARIRGTAARAMTCPRADSSSKTGLGELERSQREAETRPIKIRCGVGRPSFGMLWKISIKNRLLAIKTTNSSRRTKKRCRGALRQQREGSPSLRLRAAERHPRVR